jgi:hypothetical protein
VESDLGVVGGAKEVHRRILEAGGAQVGGHLVELGEAVVAI